MIKMFLLGFVRTLEFLSLLLGLLLAVAIFTGILVGLSWLVVNMT